MEKTFHNIKQYWEKRATLWSAQPKATTDDHWLRIIEIREIIRTLKRIRKKRAILDIGCGDGFSTIRIAQSFPNSTFLGVDYSKSMIESARLFLRRTQSPFSNVTFQVLDARTLASIDKKFDVIISDRCLINLPTAAIQKQVMQDIWHILPDSGHYIMVENFIEGHNAMNVLRKRLDLPSIPVRWHNTYVDEAFLKSLTKNYFTIKKRKNISSIYYLITRTVYSKICQLEHREPDYDNPIYKIAADLDESIGNYGPVNLILLRKKPLYGKSH